MPPNPQRPQRTPSFNDAAIRGSRKFGYRGKSPSLQISFNDAAIRGSRKCEHLGQACPVLLGFNDAAIRRSLKFRATAKTLNEDPASIMPRSGDRGNIQPARGFLL